MENISTAISDMKLESETISSAPEKKIVRFRTEDTSDVGCSYSSADISYKETLVDNMGSTSNVATDVTEADVEVIDDCLFAIALQISLISEDREQGLLGKATADSDTQIAIDDTLQAFRQLEESLKLGKCLVSCGYVPESLISEMEPYIDPVVLSDRMLALRLSDGDQAAEESLRAESVRYFIVSQYFCKEFECCSCRNVKKAYAAPCGHYYCQGCTQSLFKHALKDRAFIPIRCCKTNFDPDIVEACLSDSIDVKKYRDVLNEIENPCPPQSVLDLEASKVIVKEGWKICARCGAVVERSSGCVHMTCLCRHEFCYTCEKVWRTCKCELYPAAELARILDDRVVDNNVQERQRLQNVLVNFYDHHHKWISEPSYQRVCTVCHWTMPRFCMRCRECLDVRCWRCSHNE